MKRAPCGVCGARTSKRVRARMLAADGELHPVRICGACLRRAVVIVTRPANDPLGLNADCGSSGAPPLRVRAAVARVGAAFVAAAAARTLPDLLTDPKPKPKGK